MAQPNGTATGTTTPGEAPSTVVGINFGNSFASIAENQAECIANEDGERQIACAVSFFGEEVYIGNQAKPQLVKNAANTIVGFRNLLGKKFSDIPVDQSTTSAPVIKHPESDLPAYEVTVLVPAPAPIAAPKSSVNTPAASIAPTPRSEPIEQKRILTVPEVTTMFLQTLLQSAEDFLGKKVDGAVIAVPTWFEDSARDALVEAAHAAGIKVLQLLDEAGAASVFITEPRPAVTGATILESDRTSLILDVGASSVTLSLLAIREGLAYSLGSSHDTSVGGNAIDDRLIHWFAKEFTKKTKTPISVLPSPTVADARAEAKLRIAVEHTKRTLSASPGAASCSVESLKDGIDFTGTINRLRFDVEMKPLYHKIGHAIKAVLAQCQVDPVFVDEVVFVGSTAALPGLRDSVALEFPETTEVSGNGDDPSQIIARGAALQARLIASISAAEDASTSLHVAFEKGSDLINVTATQKPLGILFPGPDEENKGPWLTIIAADTPIPALRKVTFDVDPSHLEGSEKILAFEVWEAKDDVDVELIKFEKVDDADDDEEEEEDEPAESRTKKTTPETYLASVSFPLKSPTKTQVSVEFLVEKSGEIKVTAAEVTAPTELHYLTIPST
ncbi:actin-like ATPase domain-containing protein [Sistotremastrum suecicum HHB10207 ss-3]|uniref:Actin-like ATPase domain-containing protein n=1 Tax=Sistotremastrum suecicum HHB10207 ss-3 TaxID=1314776 RepID=A0A165YE32_9AGAM|nr:actin-like ATPase domain-containing protein [Sistotremastrum suecicum HHB10207 ss-3]